MHTSQETRMEVFRQQKSKYLTKGKTLVKQHPKIFKGIALGGIAVTAYTMGGVVAQATAISGASIIAGAYLFNRIPQNYNAPIDAEGFSKLKCKFLEKASKTRQYLTQTNLGHFILDASAMTITAFSVGTSTVTGIAIICISGVMTSLFIDLFCRTKNSVYSSSTAAPCC